MNADKQLKDPRLRVFAYMEQKTKLPFVRMLLATIRFLFVDLAPCLPKARIFSLTERGRWQIFWSAYTVAFILCFVVTGIWAVCVGTFMGDQAGVRYFMDDWHNLVLYILVCPTYVGLATVLIATVAGGYWELRRLEEEVAGESLELQSVRWRVPGVIFFVLIVSFVLTALYISDVTNVKRVKYVYWFVEKVGQGEVRLNSLGVYYFLLNFTLLLVTLIALAFFMSAFAATVRVASALTRPRPEGLPLVALESMKTKLQTFVGAYLAAKLLVGVYVINFWVWEKSPLGNTGNLLIAHIFLMLVGVFFLAIPRDYIELQWHRYKLLYCQGEPDDLNLEHLIDGRARVWAMGIDNFLIGSIIYIPVLSRFLSYSGGD